MTNFEDFDVARTLSTKTKLRDIIPDNEEESSNKTTSTTVAHPALPTIPEKMEGDVEGDDGAVKMQTLCDLQLQSELDAYVKAARRNAKRDKREGQKGSRRVEASNFWHSHEGVEDDGATWTTTKGKRGPKKHDQQDDDEGQFNSRSHNDSPSEKTNRKQRSKRRKHGKTEH